MSLGERVWDTFKTVVQMKDRIAALTDAVRTQQTRIEELTGRMIRLETTIALLLREQGPSLDPPGKRRK